jgi:hypothetical protein
MKFAWTWMSIASGALLLGGWGSKQAIQDGAGLVVTEAPAFEVSSGCAGEVIRWSHDAAAGVLKVEDGRVQLNCCGTRSVHVERVDSVLEVTQRDAPDGAGRCASMCAFDLSNSITDVQAGEVFVKLLRDVTDEGGGPMLVWQGSLDLLKGSGVVVVDADAAKDCQVAAR